MAWNEYKWTIGQPVIYRSSRGNVPGILVDIWYEHPTWHDDGLVLVVDLSDSLYGVPQNFRRSIQSWLAPGYYTFNIDTGLVGQGYTREILTIR